MSEEHEFLSPNLERIIPREAHYYFSLYSPQYRRSPRDNYSYPETWPGEDSLPEKSRESNQSPWGKSPLPQTPRDPLDQYLAGKRAIIEQSIEDIQRLINERHSLKDTLLHKIDYDSSQTKRLLFPLEHWEIGLHPNIDRMRMNVEREINTFEREKRMEEVACWRDVTRLKSDLRETLTEYALEKRKDAFLGSGK